MSQPSCEERIDQELENRISVIKAVFRFHELLEEHRWDKDSWKEELLRERRDGLLDKWEAKELWDELLQVEADSDKETPEEWLDGALSFDKLYTVYRLQLSWGGPSDEFLIYRDEDGDIDHIEYAFKDWFDGANRRLSGDDLATMERLLDYLYIE